MDDTAIKFETVQKILDGDGPQDFKAAAAIVLELKRHLVAHKYLTAHESDCSTELRVKFRDVLEFDAIINITQGDLRGFERAVGQLKCYYFRARDLPLSHRMPLLLGLHLVHLLARKELVAFNIELPLSREVAGLNDYIEYAAALHESIINNSFSRLFFLETQMPSDLFQHITGALLEGARNTHADSIQRAYSQLTVSDLVSMLHFQSREEAARFVDARQWRVWEDGETILFAKSEAEKAKPVVDMVIRAVELSTEISALA
jgi:hypothetical protein